MSEIYSSLYWSMPTPQAFMQKVTEAARSARALILSFPEYMPVDPIHALEIALKNANIHEPVILNIFDGMPISVEVGTHFNMPNMPAQVLAHHIYGAQHAVVLNAKGKRAQEHCEKYAKEFVDALDHTEGDVRLVMAIRSGEHEKDAQVGQVRIIAFDGGLKYQEMEAYVAQQMVSYPGPGSTSLYKHLVTEFGSFDAGLAERLSRMDTSQILALPSSLTTMMSEDMLRWSRCTWLNGARSMVSQDIHPLYEWYAANHSGEGSEKFKKAIERRYWKACLKAIIPWLEERRPKIIQLLDRPLKQIEKAAGGVDRIEKKVGNEFHPVTRDELEYNDIVFQSKQYAFNRIPLNNKEIQAVGICWSAKNVRDDLSHLRAPKAEDLSNLIASMDQLITF